MRAGLLGICIIFLGSFLILTIHAAIDRGFTVLTILSVFVVGVMGIGILGAIWDSFDDED